MSDATLARVRERWGDDGARERGVGRGHESLRVGGVVEIGDLLGHEHVLLLVQNDSV